MLAIPITYGYRPAGQQSFQFNKKGLKLIGR